MSRENVLSNHNTSVVQEEIANSGGAGGVAAIGIGSQGEPGIPRGKFAGNMTFKLPTKKYNSFLHQNKADRKWWQTYMGEDCAAELDEVRAYARKNPKSPIVFEDQDTGYCFYARYGKKDKSLNEAPLLDFIGKKEKFNQETGKKISDKKIADENLRSHKEYGHIRYTHVAKMGEHDIYHDHDSEDDEHRYIVRHRETGRVDGTVSGQRNAQTKTFLIHTADATGKGPKMHKVYRKILASDHSTSLMGVSHSKGGQRLWQNLAKERGVSIHGWHEGRPVNLDPHDEDETHANEVDAHEDPASRDVYNTHLVASLVKPTRKVVRKKTS